MYHAEQQWHLSSDSGIYGLGQHQDGVMNFRNEEVTLVQTNTVAVNPFLVSTDGFGLLWDNPSKTVFCDSDEGASFGLKLLITSITTSFSVMISMRS